MLSKVGWAHARIATKGIGEIVGVGIAAHLRNLRDAVRMVEQQLLCVLQAQNAQIVGGCGKICADEINVLDNKMQNIKRKILS